MMKKFLAFITTVALVSVILCASFVSAADFIAQICEEIRTKEIRKEVAENE